MTIDGRRRGRRRVTGVGGVVFWSVFGMVGVVSWGAGLGVELAEAHKAITSKYTYNEDVFPVLRDRCGRCHVPDGVAPMSLVTYKDAYPWGESVRAEIIAGHMPPWHALEGGVRFKNAPAITAAEAETYFGERVDAILDGGKAETKLPSTVIDATGDEVRLVREGIVAWKQIQDALTDNK